MSAFMELGVLPELSNALDELDWILPTGIQQEAIPAILGGGDVLMAAETGSGKTGAFCLPILEIVWETKRDIQLGKYKKTEIKHNWCLSIFDKDVNLGIHDDGLTCESTHPKLWNGCRSTIGVIGKGRYYYEVKITSDGLCRVGWSTNKASRNLGTDDKSFGFGGTGKKSHANTFEDYGESFTLYDVIGCFIDLSSGKIHFSKNGKEFPEAFNIPLKLRDSAMFPAFMLKNAALEVNFGADPFKFPPENYLPLTEALDIDTQLNIIGAKNFEEKVACRPNNAPMCVIIEPTRELAQQTNAQIENFKKFLDNPNIKNVLVTAGSPLNDQIQLLNDGCDIVTCTPSRMVDLFRREKILMNHVRFFVLDEADSMIANRSDSMQAIRELHSNIPRYSSDGQRLQMIVCSATLHNFDVEKLAKEFMHFPQWIDLKGQDSVPDTVHQVICLVDPKVDKSWIRLRSTKEAGIHTDGIHANDMIRPGSDQPETLSEAVKVLKFAYLLGAIEEHKMNKAIIFCRTKLDCDNCEKFLKFKGHSCVCLHSDRSSNERTENLAKFKDGEAKFLICTDVAARGIDVREVPYVFNVTLPPCDDKANYVHRIGRVGRADRMGLAISLVSTVPEKVWFHQCKNRGLKCSNTQLVNKRGCAKWFDEIEALGAIEEHLGLTLARIENDFSVPVFEYEGKVSYGSKRANEGAIGYSHAVEMIDAVKGLADLECKVQLNYLKSMMAR